MHTQECAGLVAIGIKLQPQILTVTPAARFGGATCNSRLQADLLSDLLMTIQACYS